MAASSVTPAANSPFISARLGLWLPEPTDSLTQTLCKVYGIGSTDPMLQGLVQLHLNLNRDVFSQYAPLEKKVIYLADLHANKGTRLAGSALVVVDAALTCHKLSNTREEHKVETAYKEIGGFGGALLTGLVVGVALVSMATPVGWIGAVVISSASAYGGKAVGQGVLGAVFDSKGDFLNLENGRILNSWCK